jgi:hypothetical protein
LEAHIVTSIVTEAALSSILLPARTGFSWKRKQVSCQDSGGAKNSVHVFFAHLESWREVDLFSGNIFLSGNTEDKKVIKKIA